MFETIKVGLELSLPRQVSKGLEALSSRFKSTAKDAEKPEAKPAGMKRLAIGGGRAAGLPGCVETRQPARAVYSN